VRIIEVFLFIGVLNAGCGNNNSSRTTNIDTVVDANSLKIFRGSEEDYYYKLIINDTFCYCDTQHSTMVSSPGIYIGHIKKGVNDDSIKVYLKINNRDTLFSLNVKGIDSLLLGRIYDNNRFHILTNLNRDGWLID